MMKNKSDILLISAIIFLATMAIFAIYNFRDNIVRGVIQAIDSKEIKENYTNK